MISDQAGELLRLVKEHLRGEQRTPYRQETTLPDFVEQALREADKETDEQRQARLRLEEEIYQETMAGRLKAALGRAPTGDELNTAIAVTRRMPLRPNDPRLWEMVLGAVKDPRRSIMAQPRNRQAK
jgi:hypothetical protein